MIWFKFSITKGKYEFNVKLTLKIITIKNNMQFSAYSTTYEYSDNTFIACIENYFIRDGSVINNVFAGISATNYFNPTLHLIFI